MTVLLKRAPKTKDASGLTAGRNLLKKAEKAEGTRRCLATGEMKPKAEMLRFVVGPEDTVILDLAENLPGHGLWVSVTAAALQAVVKKNLFAKAAQQNVSVPATLLADVSRLLRKRCLDFLGIAKGASLAVLGESQTETALREGKCGLYLQAPDASRVLDNRHSTPIYTLLSREEMGAALGYGQIVYAGLLPHRLTTKLKTELEKLRSMMDEGKE